MTTELTFLALSLVLALVQLMVAAAIVNASAGPQWGVGARDAPRPGTPPLVGLRLERAFRNLLETLPLAIGAILIAHAAGRHNGFTLWGAQLYFWGRLAYVLVYAAGIPIIRSVVWVVATLGIVAVLLGLVWG